MIPKYRQQAGITLLASIILITAMVLLNQKYRLPENIHIIMMLLLSCLYIYGCYLLIKAKGHSSAILLFGIPFFCLGSFLAVMIAPLVTAIALPDKFARPNPNLRRRRRFWGWMERRGQNRRRM
jgi:hypothetical protein